MLHFVVDVRTCNAAVCYCPIFNTGVFKRFLQGSSRTVNMMDWDKIWAFNKKVRQTILLHKSNI